MEILTLRAPEFRTAIGPPYPYRLYSITYVRPAISYAVIETQWDWPTIFHPPSDLRTASDTGDWYRGLRQFIVPIVTRSMDLLFRNRRLVTNIVDQIIERNRDWIAVPECCTNEALGFFIQQHSQRTSAQLMSGFSRAAGNALPAVEGLKVSIEGVGRAVAGISDRDWRRLYEGRYDRERSSNVNELKVSIEGVERDVAAMRDLRIAKENVDKWQAERDAEEAERQAIRDAEARRPPTRSGSIEQ